MTNLETFLAEVEGRLKQATPGADYYFADLNDLAKLLAIVRVQAEALAGCSDGNCKILGRRSGQVTNGRCHCSDNIRLAQSEVNRILGGVE